MTTAITFRMLFLVLLVGVMGMRIYFTLRVRQAGERVIPDRQAIQREGQVTFAARTEHGQVLPEITASPQIIDFFPPPKS